MYSKKIIFYSFFLFLLSSLNYPYTPRPFIKSASWLSSNALLLGAYYGVYNALTPLYTTQLHHYFPSLQRQSSQNLSTGLSLITVFSTSFLTHATTAPFLQNLIYIISTGKKLSPEQCEQCIDSAVEYALYIQILNTIRLELNETINTINIIHYQTFSNRPEILDEIFSQLTQHEVMSDFNKLMDIHVNLFNEIVREIFIIIDTHKISTSQIAPLQDITHALKKEEKASYEKLIAYLRINNHLGLYHILHDIYAQLKIVKAGLQQGINIYPAASLLHKTLSDFLMHWPEIAYPLYTKVEKSLKHYYRLQTLENIISTIRSIKN